MCKVWGRDAAPGVHVVLSERLRPARSEAGAVACRRGLLHPEEEEVSLLSDPRHRAVPGLLGGRLALQPERTCVVGGWTGDLTSTTTSGRRSGACAWRSGCT